MKLNYLFITILFVFGCAKDAPTLKQLPSILNLSNSSSPDSDALKLVNKSPIVVSAVSPVTVQSAESKISSDILTADKFLFFKLQSDEISSLIISKEGTHAFVGTRNGSVLLVGIIKSDEKINQVKNSLNLNKLHVVELLAGERPIDTIALSPNERYLAVGQFSLISIYDLKLRKLVYSFTRLPGRVSALAWDPRGEYLAIGRSGGDVYLWQVFNSAKGWLAKDGVDSLKAVEKYGSGGGTPIEKIIFLPSGRAFIAGSHDGEIELWRILRTEEELGIRDKTADIDSKAQGNLNQLLASPGSILDDMILNEEGTELLASYANGKVYRWKLRGMSQIGEMNMGEDATTSIQLLKVGESKAAEVLVTAGRGQNLKFWCPNDNFNFIKSPTTNVQVISADNAVTSLPNDADLQGLSLLESETFEEPIRIIRKSSSSFILWLAQKKGNLMLLDLRNVLGSSTLAKNLRRCPAK
ncbi:MAG: hypothetical protein KBC84_06150 [Proteobacteria bacterium]|nr:hypothetical protein [Pseudomonadota bacterium]